MITVQYLYKLGAALFVLVLSVAILAVDDQEEQEQEQEQEETKITKKKTKNGTLVVAAELISPNGRASLSELAEEEHQGVKHLINPQNLEHVVQSSNFFDAEQQIIAEQTLFTELNALKKTLEAVQKQLELTEHKLRAESHLRREAEETLRLLRKEHDKQLQLFEIQLQKKDAIIHMLQEKLQESETQGPKKNGIV